jgi:hypothetical protein
MVKQVRGPNKKAKEEEDMNNITLKISDFTNTVHGYYFHAYIEHIAKKITKLCNN